MEKNIYKIVYVLTADNNSLMAEQCALSQYSLLKYNKNVNIFTLTDDSSYEYLSKSLLSKYSQLIKVDCPKDYSLKEKSRYLKLTARQIIKGDFLYIDCDTIITGILTDIFNTDAQIAAVYDLHIKYSDNPFLQKTTTRDIKRTKLNFTLSEKFNGGLFFTKDTDTTRQFFNFALKTWQNYETKDFCIDQVAINYANVQFNNIIKELPGIYNCQITENGLRYLCDSRVIHYFKTINNSTFLLAHKSTLELIRKAGEITSEIDAMICNAKSQFTNRAIILCDKNILSVYNSKLFAFSLTLYKKARGLFKILDKILGMLYH